MTRKPLLGFNSRRLHHLEDCAEASWVLRTENLVKANALKGLTNSTERVFAFNWRFEPIPAGAHQLEDFLLQLNLFLHERVRFKTKAVSRHCSLLPPHSK